MQTGFTSVCEAILIWEEILINTRLANNSVVYNHWGESNCTGVGKCMCLGCTIPGYPPPGAHDLINVRVLVIATSPRYISLNHVHILSIL